MGPGDVVAGRYRLERELGRGGMGAVWSAQDTREGRAVALKLAAGVGHAYDGFKARFEREARIGCALGQSKGFVRALDWGELPDGRTLFMAMELVEGARPLDLTSGPVEARLERLEQAAELVAKAHAVGVIHRDLKPANILVARDGTPWLADFGLAKVVGEGAAEIDPSADLSLTQTGVGMGTPPFMPPEQFEDAKKADARADVYALGVMLFFALTGRLPYDGRSAAEILSRQMKVRAGEAQPRVRALDSNVSVGLDALCAEATALDADRRTSSAAVFVAALKRARSNLGRRSGRAPRAPALDAPVAQSVLGSSAPPARLPAAAPEQVQTLPEVPVGLNPRWVSPAELLHGIEDPHTRRVVAIGLAVGVLSCFLGMARFGGSSGPPPRRPEPGPSIHRTPNQPAGRALPGEKGDVPALRARAEAGDPQAMVELAGNLLDGRDVKRDPEKALEWLRRAAGLRSTDAMVMLGQHHDRTGSKAEAIRWLQQASDLGDARAEIHLEALRQSEQGEKWSREAQSQEQRLQWEREREEQRLEAERRRAAYEEARRKAAEERARR